MSVKIPKNGTVGARTPLVDGVEKVTGKAKYTADIAAVGALVGRILRSPVAHARIVSIDTSAAEALDGVVCVCTGAETPVPFGVLPIAENEYPLARDKVRYRGDPVAAVAAVDELTAEKALGLIKVEYEALPAYMTAKAAMKPGAVAIHDDKPNNILREVHAEFGDVEAGFAEAEMTREKVFTFAEVNHVHMELNATLAEYDPVRDWLTLNTTTQVPYYVHLKVAACLQMDSARIRVIKPFLGGGFGARTECLHFEIIAGLLARKARGTVRLIQTREETFIAHRGRPWTEVKMKIGLKKDGKITALALEATQAGGAYAGYGIITILYTGALMHGLYHIPAIKHDAWRVYTNTPPCGAMRGHGTVDTRAAFEALLSEMADELGIDTLKIRQINLLPEIPYVTAYAQRVMSYGLPECLEKVKAASGWDQRRGKMPKGRGLGIACSHFVSGTSTPKHWTGEPHATVNLKLDFDGGITLLTGAADIGQGSNTMATQVAAEVLGVRLDRIRVISADSALTPKDNGSYSSRVTFMVGNASLDAAEALKGILVKAAAKKLDAREEDIEVIDEVFMVAGSQDPGLTFQEVVKAALIDTGTITVKGTFTCPVEYQGDKKIRGSAIGATMGFCYAAQVVEASVDEITGKVTAHKVWVAVDVGKALNPLAVEGQTQGGVWMGMGQALSEETRYDDGRMMHGNILDYRMPTMAESPDIEVIIVESIDPNGPFGAKEASEGMLAGFLPAVLEAVHEAVGVRATKFPLSPETITELLDAREAAE
ncbi:4-hydroxybenzoyl-CoA reductase subunit alpha [Paramagnetospirillum kuznetsovii]|uniref:4-hydroxybenzoyl-CoA reductase subunit alpha n=1 Tax=Paramagnetospirillum kuznetsovii TaxID=2053833 RepID=A0A364NVU9_9PROT|nr:4-hydroxybenzoyl-CoA reductase subunit alpha [Paramagnetospirillum kuznetsovii]RAU21186.1 4-hydroxybenzoyl-CoA reductase subunit alpha [Paramagnetospirillum kuznetsovii]